MLIESKFNNLKLLGKLVIQHGIRLGLVRDCAFEPRLYNLHICLPFACLKVQKGLPIRSNSMVKGWVGA